MSVETTIDQAVPQLDTRSFAALGEGEIAYVKPISSEEVRRLFPQSPAISPDLELFALLSASGTPILVTDSREAALANAWAHDLKTVSLN